MKAQGACFISLIPKKLLAPRNSCLVSLFFTKEFLIMSVWIYELGTLWGLEEHWERSSGEHRKSIGENRGRIMGHDEKMFVRKLAYAQTLSQCLLAVAFFLNPEKFRGLAPPHKSRYTSISCCDGWTIHRPMKRKSELCFECPLHPPSGWIWPPTVKYGDQVVPLRGDWIMRVLLHEWIIWQVS